METAVIILAAGQGTRMKSTLPKVMHPLAGRPMVHMVLETARSLASSRIIAVIGPGMEQLAESIESVCPEAQCVVQEKQQGTADAVKAALPYLHDFTGKVVVLYGDTPLIHTHSIQKMLESDGAVTVLGFHALDPMEYGRLIAGEAGELFEIVEFKEASKEQRAIDLCNSGVMAIQGRLLSSLLNKVQNNNVKGEYYLTDIVSLARKENYHCRYILAEEAEVLGINSRLQLAEAEKLVQQRLRMQVLENGATLINPETVTFCFDTMIGQDVVIHPYVVFGRGAVVENGVEIRSFCHIEGATIRKSAIIGPFARLRPHSTVGANAKVGNFVEIKNAVLAEEAKVNHLSYIGDAEIGSRANIGAGTITCNYDGVAKHRTVIGKESFIGSNTALVAPVILGDGVVVGAGSTITKNVDDNALAIARSKQVNLEGKGIAARKKKKPNNE